GKDLPPNGDLKTPQVGEIGFAQLPWPVLLRKIDFLCRSSRRPPVLDLALQRPQLPLREPLRILPLQLRKNRLGFQPRVPAQLLFNFPPDVLELILVRSPVTLRLYLARQPSRPRYFRPVFTSIPALAAAISCVLSVFDTLNNLLTCWSVTIRKAPSHQRLRIVSVLVR